MYDKNAEKQILMAFFDILGTSKMLNQGDFQTVYDYYAFMSKLCSDTHTPIAVVDHISRFLNSESESSHMQYTIINYDLKHCFFSDTFLLWIELDPFLQPTMAGFLEKCCIIFCEALKRGIPLRGVISCGTAIMDEENHIFLGEPLAEAAKAEPRQNWLGVGIGRSISNIHPMDMNYILPYFKHFKSNRENLLSGWVLDWPSWWRENENADVIHIINHMNTDATFESYYNNCISFIEISEHRESIWNVFMIFQDIHKLSKLCEMGNDISDELKITRQQGIEILTSQKVLDYIQNILDQNGSKWLGEKDKYILEIFQDGYILINERPVSINRFK